MKTSDHLSPAARGVPLACHRRNGFALVISLSLMVLLTVLAVGLLGLSSLSLATSVRETDLAEARANARMALSLAISQLQKQTGPDQRITTTADQLSSGGDGSDTAAADGRRHWTGTYRSWASTANTRPSPQFLSWLVSGEASDLEDIATAKSAAGGDETIELVGEGTVGESKDGWVNAPALTVESPTGGPARFAWWTGDQGTKAAMATPPPSTDSSLAALRAGLQAAPRNALELVKTGSDTPFEALEADDSRLALVTDWKQAAFLAADTKSPQPLFHDISPFSTGLLTNVRTGGFRKDLSMHLERPISTAASSALYTVSGETGINLQELRAYYQLYKEVKKGGGTKFTTGGTIPSSGAYVLVDRDAATCRNDEEFFFKQPVIISYQLVLSFEARVHEGRQRLHVVADPILTFWNPLDVAVVIPTSAFMSIKYWQVPYDLFISVGGGAKLKYPLAASLAGAVANSAGVVGNGDSNYLSLQAGAIQQLVFKPGEVIKVSQSGNTLAKGSVPDMHKLAGRAGFNYGGGVSLPVRDTAGNYIDLSAASTITYEARPNNLTAGATASSGHSVTGGNAHTRHFSLTHHEYYIGEDRGSNSLGIGGMCIDWDFGNKRLKPTETRSETQPGTKPSGSRLYANTGHLTSIFKPITAQEARPLSVAQLASEKAPFMMLSYNAKTENGSDLGTRYLSRFNPKALHVDFYDLTASERDLLPYEFSMERLDSWKNRSLETTPNGQAYFGGSMNAEFGTNFVTTHSVPREPIVSLAAFQHSFANGFEMQKPKYGYAALNSREPLMPQISHAVGNSMAPSVIAANKTEGASGPRPLADHSYLANLGLWDEWFMSGIAPQIVAGFGTKRAQRVVGEEFLKGTGKLPVVRYLPDTDGVDASKVLASFFSGATPNDTGTKVAASLIRVDGLFNVNSTSVEAWKAMLGSLKGRQVVVRDVNGGESIDTSEETPVANLHGPQNLVAQGNGNVDVKDPEQWVGRRELTEDNIDNLARAIVKEVRRRGPFLSLADFINRRPGNDQELARAGTIQSALDSDEAKINSAYLSSGRVVAGTVASRLAFPDAEAGPAGYGMPGIVKQADILTPIAPVLSARSDSFIIRAYGESVDKDGKVLARAWCEATVERDKNFIDTEDKPETVLTALKSDVNETFGRRYEMTSFRWLHPDEV